MSGGRSTAGGLASSVTGQHARPFPEVADVDVEHSFVRARGLSFHVAFAGPPDAEPLLLLHGWPQHWYLWRKVLPALSARRRCVMPDLRGLGWSEAPAAGYEKQTLADDVLAILDELGIERTDLIAHDWGGWIGFLIALRAPERLHRYLALNIVPPWPARAQRPRPRDALRLWRLWYQVVLATPLLGETLLRRTPVVARALRADNVHADAFSDAEVAAFADVLAEPARARASSLLYRVFLLREIGPVIGGRYEGIPLTVPTRLLFGVQDFALGGEVPREYAEHAPSAFTVELVQDSGHFIAEERPDVVVARARELLGA